jgi:carboxylesterase type B
VTVFGHSTGSTSIAALLTAPEKFTTYKEKPLFHAAIMQSGGFVNWAS